MQAALHRSPPKIESRPAPQPSIASEYPLSEPPRILIVEDDSQLAEVIRAILINNWFNCTIRCSGAQGIESFYNDPVDLIITDLRMQAGDGITLIEGIRRMSPAPVIIITGYAAEYADRVRFLNNVALINKPFDSAKLIALIDKAIDVRNSGSSDGWNTPCTRP